MVIQETLIASDPQVMRIWRGLDKQVTGEKSNDTGRITYTDLHRP